jgi:hypothetical protein
MHACTNILQEAWRVLARLADIRQAVLRGLTRLTDYSPKAIFEKNVTCLAKFARVTRKSREFGASGHSLRKAPNLQNCPKFKTLMSNLHSAIIWWDNLCYYCLVEMHYARDCQFWQGHKCGIDYCDKYHHPTLYRNCKTDDNLSVNFISF